MDDSCSSSRVAASRPLQVVARPHLLNAERHIGCLPVGMTLAEIVQECYRRGDVPATMRTGAIVQVNGEIVPRERWHLIRPKETANVCVSVSLNGGGGGGGKNPMATILAIVVVVASVVLGQYYGASFASAIGVKEATGAALLTFASPSIGALLVNASEFPA